MLARETAAARRALTLEITSRPDSAICNPYQECVFYISHVHLGIEHVDSMWKDKTCRVTGRTFCLLPSEWANHISSRPVEPPKYIR